MAVKKRILTLALIVNLVTCSLATQFIQDDILAFPRYKVVLTNEKIPNSQINHKDVELSSAASSSSSESTAIIMTSSSGQPFSCSIPNVQVEQERLEREKEENAQEETEQDVQRTIDRGLELLEPLGINCIRFFASTHQYWAYEYCHNQYVRQYHIEHSHDGKVEREQETASFYLGIYPGSLDSISEKKQDDKDKKALSATNDVKPKKTDNKAAPTFMRKVGEQRYLVQEWKNGSNCDLTDKPRTVEVQYHCDAQGQDRVSSFIEVSTCHYQIVVSTPRLCEEMNLSHRHHAESHKIECRPIVSDKLIEQEQQIQQQLLQQLEEEEPAATDVTPEEEEAVILAEEHIKKLLDKVVVEEEKGGSRTKEEQDFLYSLISDLTEQVNQLKLQMSHIPPTDSSAADKKKQPEISIFTFDENGHLVPGADLSQLIRLETTKQKKEVEENKAKDQQDNKQAYHQNYIAAAGAGAAE